MALKQTILAALTATLLAGCAAGDRTGDYSYYDNVAPASPPPLSTTTNPREMGWLFYRAEECDKIGYPKVLDRLANTHFRTTVSKQVTHAYYLKAAEEDPKRVWSFTGIFGIGNTIDAEGPTEKSCNYWLGKTTASHLIGKFDDGLFSAIFGGHN